MKIILSIKEEHWKKILAGTKTIEVRKSRPLKVEYPCRVIVYVSGKGVAGHFDLAEVSELDIERDWQKTGLTQEELKEYQHKSKTLWGWHVKPGSIFRMTQFEDIKKYGVNRPPMSWGYKE